MQGPDEIHIPVKLERTCELLAPALVGPPGQSRWVIDCTLGMGGHAAALLALAPDVRLLGIDRDPQALAMAEQRLAFAGDRAVLIHAVFDELRNVIAQSGIHQVHGVLLDLGVSSLQLDSPDRGFAYARNAPLDMRMDPGVGQSAMDVVNTYTGKELAAVFRDFGEERFAGRIADAIVASRREAPISTTGGLSQIVRDAIPAPARRTGGHPAKRVFQALRIEVNDELGALMRVLPAMLQALAINGRAIVLSYHSLEDRIVKRAFTAATASDVPPDLPVVAPEPPFVLLTRGAELAEPLEVDANPRAASVRLRAIARRSA